MKHFLYLIIAGLAIISSSCSKDEPASSSSKEDLTSDEPGFQLGGTPDWTQHYVDAFVGDITAMVVGAEAGTYDVPLTFNNPEYGFVDMNWIYPFEESEGNWLRTKATFEDPHAWPPTLTGFKIYVDENTTGRERHGEAGIYMVVKIIPKEAIYFANPYRVTILQKAKADTE